MARQTLIQEQKLQQKLSPQQIQLMRLLELNEPEMEERVKQELEENPALEEGLESEYDDNFDISNIICAIVPRSFQFIITQGFF